jgi:hypothetical protein
MKTISHLLMLFTIVSLLGGCIDADQGGQRGKNEGRDASDTAPKTTNN